jgi:hypothetical protein
METPDFKAMSKREKIDYFLKKQDVLVKMTEEHSRLSAINNNEMAEAFDIDKTKPLSLISVLDKLVD